MNVGTIRSLLNAYRDDDELFIVWWDAAFLKEVTDADLSASEWRTIVDRTRRTGGIEDWVSSEVWAYLEDAVNEVLSERMK